VQIAARVSELLELVQLEGLAERYPAQLSGGQRQRVALARALAIEPRVLLLDEPFGALDARVRKDLRRWLREIHQRTGLTTVFVTHDQDEAMELADRVVVLNEGRIEQVGSPDQLYDQPASPFVLSFVGEAVALPVTVSDGLVALAGRELHVDTHGLRDGRARVFFRPADIAIVEEGAGSLEGRIESLRRTSSGVRATISIDGSDQFLEIDQELASASELGAKVPLSLSNARVFAYGDGEYEDAGEGIRHQRRYRSSQRSKRWEQDEVQNDIEYRAPHRAPHVDRLQPLINRPYRLPHADEYKYGGKRMNRQDGTGTRIGRP